MKFQIKNNCICDYLIVNCFLLFCIIYSHYKVCYKSKIYIEKKLLFNMSKCKLTQQYLYFLYKVKVLFVLKESLLKFNKP